MPGDTLALTATPIDDDPFQSAPGTNAGRYDMARNFSRRAGRFNPRPARMPGDTTWQETLVAGQVVSIRARHECRAIRAIC